MKKTLLSLGTAAAISTAACAPKLNLADSPEFQNEQAKLNNFAANYSLASNTRKSIETVLVKNDKNDVYKISVNMKGNDYDFSAQKLTSNSAEGATLSTDAKNNAIKFLDAQRRITGDELCKDQKVAYTGNVIRDLFASHKAGAVATYNDKIYKFVDGQEYSAEINETTCVVGNMTPSKDGALSWSTGMKFDSDVSATPAPTSTPAPTATPSASATPSVAPTKTPNVSATPAPKAVDFDKLAPIDNVQEIIDATGSVSKSNGTVTLTLVKAREIPGKRLDEKAINVDESTKKFSFSTKLPYSGDDLKNIFVYDKASKKVFENVMNSTNGKITVNFKNDFIVEKGSVNEYIIVFALGDKTIAEETLTAK